jgi:site-specific DNA recombinase
MTKEKKVIIYSRVSTTEQADHGYSLADQEARLMQYCNLRGYNIVLKIREDASAKSFDRPQFKIIQEYIKHNKSAVDLLLIIKWDRFSRNATDAHLMIREMLKLGIRVDAAEQPIDVTIPEQKLLLSFYLAAPEVENDRRSMNTINGMRKAKLEGRFLGVAPRGYRNERDSFDKPIIVPDEEAKFIQKAFEMLSTGTHSQQEVLEELRAKGFKCNKSTFSTLIQNKIYAGKVYVKATLKEPEEWVKGIHESLVSEEVFYQVQQILAGRRLKTNRNKLKQVDENLPLRGLLLCSHCGGNLTGSASKGNGGRYYYYHCNICGKDRFRADLINEKLETKLEDAQINSTVSKLYRSMMMDELNDKNRLNQTTKLEAEVQKEQERINKLIDLLADGGISAAEYSVAKKRYEENISNLKLQLSQQSIMKNEVKEYLDWALYFLENLTKHYHCSEVTVRQKIIGSIYPEKLYFSDGELRTKGKNSFIKLFVSENSTKKNGQPEKNFKLSNQVPEIGVEPIQP